MKLQPSQATWVNPLPDDTPSHYSSVIQFRSLVRDVMRPTRLIYSLAAQY